MQYLLTEEEYLNIVKDTRFYSKDLVVCQKNKKNPSDTEEYIRIVFLKNGHKFQYEFDLDVFQKINEILNEKD